MASFGAAECVPISSNLRMSAACFDFGSHQRPELFNLVALDVEQSGALGRVKPFVQAGAEVIATQIFLLEIKLGEGVRAVDDRFDPFGARHLADCFHGRDLSGDVDLMRDQNQTCRSVIPRSNAAVISFKFFGGIGILISFSISLRAFRAGGAWSACADSLEWW